MKIKESGLSGIAHDAAEHPKPHAASVTHDSGAGATFDKNNLPPIPPAMPNFQHTTKTAKAYYEGIAQKMQDAYAKGDAAALTAATFKKDGVPVWPTDPKGFPKSMNGKLLNEYHGTLKSMLDDAKAAQISAALEKPVGKIPSPGENVGAQPAMPNFDRHQIPTTNSNAGSHNAKIFQIKTLAQKGDVKGLLALNYGTNTYGKKQVKLANDTLAALGSDLKVTAGQKKNSHPALTMTGSEQPVTHTPMGKPLSAALLDKELPPKLDYYNWNGQGKGLSSKAGLNKANQEAADNLMALAKAGDVKGIKNATYAAVDPATGEPTGKHLEISKITGTIGSKHLLTLQQTLLQTMDEKLHPPEPLKFFSGQNFKDVADLSAKVPPALYGTTTKQHPSSQAIGHYLALGQVADPTPLVPAKTFNLPSDSKTAAAKAYSLMNPTARKFVGIVQGNGSYYWRNPKSGGGNYSFTELENMAVAAHKYAHELVPGTVLYKWDDMTPDMKQKLSLAQPGLILQNPAPVCASYIENNSHTKHFGSSHQFRIIAAPGAKAVSSFASGGYSSEGEFTLLPNHRFMVLGHKKAGASGHPWAETTVLLLPPDPALDKKAQKLAF